MKDLSTPNEPVGPYSRQEKYTRAGRRKMDLAMGYPDLGNGWYGSQLSYKGWFELNHAQRIHYNFLEQLSIVLVSTLIGGLLQPWVAVGFGILYFIGRILYVRKNRYQGFMPALIGQVGLIVLGLVSAVFFVIRTYTYSAPVM